MGKGEGRRERRVKRWETLACFPLLCCAAWGLEGTLSLGWGWVW
uniref:Uncharacterized protein n=1 Tax=Arundo donax TaxID=35708 RepID=A0A0A9GHV8_ARUDO